MIPSLYDLLSQVSCLPEVLAIFMSRYNGHTSCPESWDLDWDKLSLIFDRPQFSKLRELEFAVTYGEFQNEWVDIIRQNLPGCDSRRILKFR